MLLTMNSGHNVIRRKMQPKPDTPNTPADPEDADDDPEPATPQTCTAVFE